MIGSLMAVYASINQRHQAANVLFGANEGMLSLANQVSPRMSGSDIGDVFQREGGFVQQATMAKINMAVSYAQQEAAEQQIQKDIDQQRRLQNLWA